MKKYIFFFFSILSQPILTSGQMVFASSAFYSEKDQVNINSIWHQLIEQTFATEEISEPNYLLSEDMVFCGGNFRYPRLSLDYRYCQAIYKNWVSSRSNGEMELFMKWNNSLDTCFVMSLSPICMNATNQYKSLFLIEPNSSELSGDGFSPPIRIPFDKHFLKLLSPENAAVWTKYLTEIYWRTYGSDDFCRRENNTLCVALDTNLSFYFKPKEFYSLFELIAIDEELVDIYEDSQFKKLMTWQEKEKLYQTIVLRYRKSVVTGGTEEVKSVMNFDRCAMDIGYQSHLQVMESITLQDQPDHFFTFNPQFVKFTFPTGNSAYVRYSEFIKVLGSLNRDDQLYQSAFKFSLLSHFKINQYWDGTQLD